MNNIHYMRKSRAWRMVAIIVAATLILIAFDIATGLYGINRLRIANIASGTKIIEFTLSYDGTDRLAELESVGRKAWRGILTKQDNIDRYSNIYSNIDLVGSEYWDDSDTYIIVRYKFLYSNVSTSDLQIINELLNQFQVEIAPSIPQMATFDNPLISSSLTK